MNNVFPPSGVELGLRHPHLHGLETQQQQSRTSSHDVSMPSAINGAVENVSRGLISLTRVANVDETAAQYSLRKNDE